jgi:hypothetical protein
MAHKGRIGWETVPIQIVIPMTKHVTRTTGRDALKEAHVDARLLECTRQVGVKLRVVITVLGIEGQGKLEYASLDERLKCTWRVSRVKCFEPLDVVARIHIEPVAIAGGQLLEYNGGAPL